MLPYNFADLIGLPFGRLTVLSRDPHPPRDPHARWWICQCSCGETLSVRGFQLTRGRTQSCGCLRRERTPDNFVDLTGKTFERLTVIKRDIRPDVPKWPVKWLCQCICGNSVSVLAINLTQKTTRSCGCLLREHWAISQLKHGSARKGKATPEFKAWARMRERCLSVTSKDYPRWGGRGIAICPRWIESFTAFLEDMGKKPSPKHTLERRDNDAGYSPENCYWADRLTQARNTRNNVFLTWNNETHCISEWSEIVPIRKQLISERYRAGWPVERILGTPPRRWPSQM